jgi:hypothetical protein
MDSCLGRRDRWLRGCVDTHFTHGVKRYCVRHASSVLVGFVFDVRPKTTTNNRVVSVGFRRRVWRRGPRLLQEQSLFLKPAFFGSRRFQEHSLCM